MKSQTGFLLVNIGNGIFTDACHCLKLHPKIKFRERKKRKKREKEGRGERERTFLLLGVELDGNFCSLEMEEREGKRD